jgi:hypothetical protein
MTDPVIQQELAADLFAVAQNAASAHGRKFKLGAYGNLQVIAQSAAAEVLSPARFGVRSHQMVNLDLESRKVEASKAFRALVQTMATHAQTIPGYESDKLGEQTLALALSSAGLCPCWPIC